MQDRAFANALCAPYPGAEVSQPFAPDFDVWKVGGKIFAVAGKDGDGMAVKTDSVETARLIIEMGRATRAPYFHASWLRIPFDLVPDDELRERVATSYAIIRASLPKRLQAVLGSSKGTRHEP